MKSLLSFPMNSENGEKFIFQFQGVGMIHTIQNNVLLHRFQPTLAKIIEARSGAERSNDSTHAANRFNAAGFEGIIGTNHLLLNVFDYVTQVAPFDTVVLIKEKAVREKERIAECIHNLSPAKESPS